MTNTKTPQTARIGNLDSLRGLAILGVVAVHTSGIFTTPLIFWDVNLTKLFIWSGRYGVELFFVLSGLTLTLSLKRRLTKEPNSMRAYFLRRFFRLSPMYYLILAVTACLGYNNVLEPGTINAPADIKNYLLHLTYLHGLFPEYVRSILGPAWSLTPVVLFYLFLPLILLVFNRPIYRFAFFVFTIFLANTFSKYWAIFLEPTQTNKIWSDISSIKLFFLFSAGIVLADVFIWRNAQAFKSTKLLDHIANFVFIGSVFGFYWLYYYDKNVLWTWMMIVGLVLAVCLGSTWFQRILNIQKLQHLGLVSYSVYLLHFPMIDYLMPLVNAQYLTFSSGVRYLVFFGFILGANWLLASLTHRFVELPGSALGEYLIRLFTRETRCHE